MKRFNFRLQSVLDFRQGLVDRAQAELAALRHRQRQEEAFLQALREAEATYLARMQEDQRGALDLAKLAQQTDHLALLTERVAEQAAVAEEARAAADRHQEAMMEMVKGVKALEKLRERREGEHTREGHRLEQIETSELAALRFRWLRAVG